MYLRKIRAVNFRVFGDGQSGPALDWDLSPGMNILIGENDAGKTAVIDAIRHVLWTTSYESIRLFETDFHVAGSVRANSLTIEATLSELDADQEAAVLEWLTYEADGSRNLILHLQARWFPPKGTKRGRVEVVTRAGRNGVGLEIGSAVRELVRSTYLRPLRDAEAELRPGRMSRLSQILGAHKKVAGQDISDFNADNPGKVPQTLVGLMAFAQHHLGEHEVIKDVQEDINDNYLKKFSFSGDELSSRIRIAPDLSLQPILEKFELTLLPSAGISAEQRCAHGLGYNNALFMATELVLLRDGEELALLLIEEPEAHLHPQLQDRVQRLLEKSARKPEGDGKAVQVVLSTHSPSLAASARVESMTLVHRGRTFSLAHGQTKLKKEDYDFLSRFLDATKSNLFFARGVVIVEGPAEALLLPAIAESCNRSFSSHGISIVNVGNVGLYHYARILQRANESDVIPIPVVCVTDRDVVPNHVTYIKKPANRRRFVRDYTEPDLKALIERKEKRAAGGNTIVCVSDNWTLEYDLVLHGQAELMFKAIALAIRAERRGERLDTQDEIDALAAADVAWKKLQGAGATSDQLAAWIYWPLVDGDASKAVTAQYAAHLLGTGKFGTGDDLFNKLPPYLRRAIAHLIQAPAPTPAMA